jgi:hypothetical protein
MCHSAQKSSPGLQTASDTRTMRSRSRRNAEGAREVDLTGQGAFDGGPGTAHLGILNSPVTWERAFDFLFDGHRGR